MLFDYPYPTGKTTQVLLIRHGQSTYNAAGLFQGCCDVPELTPKGVATAEAAARYLELSRISAIFSSPLTRAAETAARIAANQTELSTPVLFDELLREVHLPLWEGLSLPAVRGQFAAELAAWHNEPHLFRMGGRQPVIELFASARDFWRRQLARYLGQRILLVAHSGSCRALIGTALGMSPEYFHAQQSSNGGISILDFDEGEAGAARLRALNLTGYLGERLPKLKEGRFGLRLLLASAGDIEIDDSSRLRTLVEDAKPDLLVSAGLKVDYELSARMQRIAPRLPVEMWPVRKLLAAPPCNVPTNTLLTVLILADEWVLQHVVLNALGLSPDSLSRLRLRPWSLTSLHYSGPASRPVLQTVNQQQTSSERKPCYALQEF